MKKSVLKKFSFIKVVYQNFVVQANVFESTEIPLAPNLKVIGRTPLYPTQIISYYLFGIILIHRKSYYTQENHISN